MKNLLPFRYSNYQSGATTLVIVIGIMSLSLAIGLAVASRSFTGIRRTTYVSQTDQAYSCANSAVEIALNAIKQAEANSSTPSTTASDTINGVCNYSYRLTDIINNVEIKNLKANDVQQLIMTGDNSVSITWGQVSGTAEPYHGLEVTYAYLQSGNYNMQKYAYYCGDILPVNPDDSSPNISGFTNTGDTDGDGRCTVTLNLSPISNQSIIRIKPYFADAYVNVTGLPSSRQGYRITASGTAGRVTRNITVQRMNPQLPGLFDYVLYSETGSIQK
jgi:Tfp pilus assembly protein PilX